MFAITICVHFQSSTCQRIQNFEQKRNYATILAVSVFSSRGLVSLQQCTMRTQQTPCNLLNSKNAGRYYNTRNSAHEKRIFPRRAVDFNTPASEMKARGLSIHPEALLNERAIRHHITSGVITVDLIMFGPRAQRTNIIV